MSNMTAAARTAMRFAVVRWVPDAIRDEPVNIGIVFQEILDGCAGPLRARTIGKPLGAADDRPFALAVRILGDAIAANPQESLEAFAAERSGGLGCLRLGEILGGLARIDQSAEGFADELYASYVGDGPERRAFATRGLERAYAEVARLEAGNATHRRKGFRMSEIPIAAMLDHARAEIDELAYAIENEEPEEHQRREMADVVGILLHVMRRKGWTLDEIESRTLEKLAERFED